MIRPGAILIWLLVTPVWAMTMVQTSTEDSILAHYPKGTVFTIQTEGVIGVNGSCMFWPVSSYKNGKLHAPTFMQNAVLAAAKCITHPLQSGSQISLSRIAVKLKNGKVDFVLQQCDTSDCAQDSDSKAQVTFEFPKGTLEASGLPAVQEAVGHILVATSESASDAPPPASEAPAASAAAASVHGEPLYLYVSAQSAGDRLQLYQDGAFDLDEGGQRYSGSYAVSNTTLKLHLTELQKDVDLAMQGNQLIVNGNETWEIATLSASTESQPPTLSTQLAGDLPSIDRIEQAVKQFLDGLKQKAAIPQEATAIPSGAPIAPAPARKSAGAVAEATVVFELKNTNYMCGSHDEGAKVSQNNPAYVLSALLTEKQAGAWVLTGIQMLVRGCKPDPEWHVEIALP